ncbi:MAG: peptide ABC transporter permease, partial [Gammaproteobacteria bacterium]|nr:peptide ABC transporter permease [Gammaproteobacteria bacterium]
MLRFILTRVGLVIPTFVGITLLTFFMIRLIPGDPIELLVGERGLDPERHAELRAELGLDKPLLEQYGIYIAGVLKGDLGKSIVTKQPIINEFFTLFPATVELSICAMLFAVALGLPAGIIPTINAGVIMANVIWNMKNTVSGISPLIASRLT